MFAWANITQQAFRLRVVSEHVRTGAEKVHWSTDSLDDALQRLNVEVIRLGDLRNRTVRLEVWTENATTQNPAAMVDVLQFIHNSTHSGRVAVTPAAP